MKPFRHNFIFVECGKVGDILKMWPFVGDTDNYHRECDVKIKVLKVIKCSIHPCKGCRGFSMRALVLRDTYERIDKDHNKECVICPAIAGKGYTWLRVKEENETSSS